LFELVPEGHPGMNEEPKPIVRIINSKNTGIKMESLRGEAVIQGPKFLSSECSEPLNELEKYETLKYF
jgi:hypothetical protein